MDWSEALKGWWLEAHARAMRRGDPQQPAAPTPAPATEPPPRYDAELHAQMQADIVHLCGTIGQSIAGMNNHQGPGRRRTLSILAADGPALERDLAYLAQMRARKAVLQAQAVALQAQVSDLNVANAAD